MPTLSKKQLAQDYFDTRRKTEALCSPLTTEDYVIQSVLDVSPPKWHLAHTSWFFETFLLEKYLPKYSCFDPLFAYLFNSYYHGLGKPFPRNERGFLARPTVAQVFQYRNYVDQHLNELIEKSPEAKLSELEPLIILGLHHEQQHQELLLMDVKYNLSRDPSFPVYHSSKSQNSSEKTPLTFIPAKGGIVEIGHSSTDFCFDNELPLHQKFLTEYKIANRLVSNEEFAEFIKDGGYQEACWWLSDGWDQVQKNRWISPEYWHLIDNQWRVFTLSGLKEINPYEPVSHISYYEADAYARWAGKRLPSEEEWEHFVKSQKLKVTGNFLDHEIYQPQAAKNTNDPQHFFGDLWEWTSSAYSAYPGFKPMKGAIGEYNGKFMSNQMVLRGGSCITPESHIRASYRNFFQPEKRWQFCGIRLAENV